MPQLSQVWKLLTYVRRSWGQEIPQKTSVPTEVILPSRRMIKTQNTKFELAQNNLPQFCNASKLQQSLAEWSKRGNDETFKISDRQMHYEIYDLMGDRVLQPELVEKVMNKLITSDVHLVPLFLRLNDFYCRWCQGEFIDAPPDDNLPQQKMLTLLAQNITVGLRHLDINTGLNILILLLKLHLYAQERENLKHQIIFYPSGKPDSNYFFTSQLLRIINYSDSLEIGNFSSTVGEFLRGGNFSGAYLGDANLTGVNFSGANLSAVNLGDANLIGANFSHANLSAANLGDANLSSANFSGATLWRIDLSSSNLSGADLNSADLGGANLSSADLSSTDLSGANLRGANLTNANLKDAKLCHAQLCDAILFGANLSDANLIGVDLCYADLCRADLSGANLSQGILRGTNLSDSILFNTNLKDTILDAADLSYAKLNGAKLNNAHLKGTMLMGADLSNVDLKGVNLNEADLSGVLLSEANLSGANLSNAMLFGTDFSCANLSNANLSGSNLSGAILNGADLSYTNISYAILSDANLSDANLEKMTWNENLEWEGVRGLDKAVNVPDALKQRLGLR